MSLGMVGPCWWDFCLDCGLIRLWSPFLYKMTLALATLLRYGMPQMLMLNAVYACLLIRWIKIGKVRGDRI